VLTGERVPPTVVGRIAEAVIVVAFMSPFLGMGGGLTLLGVLALGPRKDIPELWICLPAGIALLLLCGGLLYWALWRVPRRTITRFAFDGSELVFEAPARGCVTRPIGALRSVVEERGRRGGGLRGWWLKFEGVAWVYLTRSMPNAESLVGQIGSLVGYKTAEPAPSAGRPRD
jgi:hypothetical protein